MHNQMHLKERDIVIFLCTKRFSNFIKILGMANVLVFLNTILNPFHYSKQAVKQTTRRAICYALG